MDTQNTGVNMELNTYLKHIHDIYQLVTNNINTTTTIDKGPTFNHKELHLESFQKEFHGIEYAPILISKTFSELYTNTGILKMGNKMGNKMGTMDITGINKKTLIDTLNLKIYNNKYYYIDLPYSYNHLDNHYKLNIIIDEWQSIINE